jgi:AAA domain
MQRFKTMLSKHKPATAKNTPAAAAPPLDEDDNYGDMIYDDLALELLIDQMRSEDDSYAKDRRITREVAPYILSRMMTDRLRGGKDIELSHLFSEFQTGFPNDEEGNARSKQFQDAIKQMASDIPLSCSVIITTLGNCDDLGSIKGFRPATVLVDEAGVCTEPDLIMAIANFSEAEAFVLCGDPKQNPPTVISSAKSLVYHNHLTINNFETKHEDDVVKTGQPTAPEAPQNEFSEQLKTSPLVRLVERLQWPSIMLTHQHRAVPGIRQIWGKLYDNRIQDAPGTEVNSRQNAMKFQTLMKEKHGLDNCSYVVMDVWGSVNKNSGTSTYNPAFIDVALGCLENLFTANFPATDICIITPYQAERRAFISAFTHMSKTLKAEGAWVEQLQFVEAATIDGFQGDERR